MTINMQAMLYLIYLDIRKAFRDVKYVAFIILLPVLFYLLYTHIFSTKAAVGTISWSEYSLVSMISFGIMGNSINLLGTKIADEKNKIGTCLLKRLLSIQNCMGFLIYFLIY
ncbi:TPA: hypothetical protein QFJ79_002462 [Enterococcus faecium]